jgi:hypothetical protein
MLNRITVTCYKYLCQGIKLTGLGEESFSQAIAAAQEIYSMFDQQFSDGALETWPLSYLGDTQTLCLDTSNQYFMPSKDAPGKQNTPFHDGVDPHQILTNMMTGSTGQAFIHAEENQVQYYKSHKGPDRGRRYRSSPCRVISGLSTHLLSFRFDKWRPQVICVGDLIEIQVFFVRVPLKDKQWKMLVVHWQTQIRDAYRSSVHYN